ncbi:hypothetical protein [Conexibacter sp. S30A1]|uniref:hypothetical protein n=1 Tax=Conexibacter sp. S30A1 TaxID=2937800 RepID=UPI00200C13EA|nr:hypothetical protein [Conexibacter sp. S30A1]
MGDYRVTVSMPTAAYADYPTIVGLLAADALTEPPILLEMDDEGNIKSLHREQGQPQPESLRMMIGVRVHGVGPLEAVTTAFNLVAQKMGVAKLDAHYPTVYHVLPVKE